MGRIAKVIVEIALNREFDYRIPEDLAADIVPGVQVEVPFGKRFTRGFVTAVVERTELAEVKDIRRRVGDKPLIEPAILELARWISGYYCAPIEHAVRTVLPSAVRGKGARFKERLHVACEPEACMAAALAALRAGAPRRADVLAVLSEAGEMPLRELVAAARTTVPTIRKLAADGFVRIATRAELRNPLSGQTLVRTGPLKLMPQQADALALCVRAMDTLTPPVVLLYGVTGSGKTEVYLQAIQHAVDRGQGAVVLVPEISLTPQTVERFQSRFGDRIAVLHSSLSSGERHDEWHRIHDGRASIVIGARSALFAPVRNPGLIVVDEEHEPSYKQEESPRYHARDVAVMRGCRERCAVILGSATPSLESMQNVRLGKYALAVLAHRVDHRRMPVVTVIDLRAEKQREGRVNVLAKDLVLAMQDRLQRREQCILFLNRRGFSTSLTCTRCGYVARCDDCSVSMTYHKRRHELCCHICGERRPVPAVCPNPECRDPDFRYGGIGTQKVEEVVGKIFPRAVIERMDADTTSGKGAHARILDRFRAGEIDILIGTQMIAKGLHFPNVTLVGVINADLSLHIPDFRASERTFQLIAQMAGRSGRGATQGDVLVQTLSPEHPAIVHARTEDFQGFAAIELAERRELAYPPFTRFTCITLRGRDPAKVAAYAQRLADAIGPSDRFILGGPGPAPLEKTKQDWRFQITLRGASAAALAAAIRQGLAAARLPAGVSIALDVDALNSL